MEDFLSLVYHMLSLSKWKNKLDLPFQKNKATVLTGGFNILGDAEVQVNIHLH